MDRGTSENPYVLMSASDESKAETSRIKGTRKRKLRSSRHACTARLPARGRRYRWRRKSEATWRGTARLEDCTLRLRATHQPVREQHEEETDDRLERAGRGRHAHISDGCERPVDVGVDDVGGRIELGRVACDLIEEAEVGVEDPADREQHVDDDQGPQQRQRYVPDLLPRCRTIQAGGLVILGVDRDHPRQVDYAPEAAVLPDGDEGEDH